MTYEKGADYCTMSPDVLFGVRISHACYLHDRQYRNEVRERKSREEADLDLFKNIVEEFEKKGKKKLGILVGIIYYSAVRLFCGIFWVRNDQ